MKQVTALLLMSISSLFCFAQQRTDFDFLIEKIKNNYPGYEEKTQGIDFDKFVKKTMVENLPDTFKAMSKITNFFKDRHLDLFEVKAPTDTFECKKNLVSVSTYFKKQKILKKYEGIWVSEFAYCTIAIKQVSKSPLKYLGYVIESRDSNKITPGAILYDFEDAKGKTFFTRATLASGLTSYVYSTFRNDSVMTAGPYNKWRKIQAVPSSILGSIKQKPNYTTGRFLDSNNYVISIPASTSANGKIVDSIIKSNSKITSGLNTLIVDIRGNTGGKVQAYSALLPLLYTKPILRVNGSLYSSNDYIKKNQKEIGEYIAAGNIDSGYLKKWESWVSNMRANIGRFIDSPQDTLKFDSIYKYPERIAIIVDYGCQSAAEIFLLEAMQSNKVTIFGEHTMGAIDYLNFYSQISPSGKYSLYIATTRRKLLNDGQKLDGKGIEPKIVIPDTEMDWVDYVKRYYEER